eukprot:SAG31_NODE_6234_length_2108_cov_1.090592_1_plen_137_part_00
MTCGDVCAQILERLTSNVGTGNATTNGASAPASQQKLIDLWRTLRFAIVGGTCHGPFFNVGFAWVDRLFGSPLAANGSVLWLVLAKKVLTTQFILNPPYMLILFSWIGVLEGRTSVAAIVKNTLVRAFVTSLQCFR